MLILNIKPVNGVSLLYSNRGGDSLVKFRTLLLWCTLLLPLAATGAVDSILRSGHPDIYRVERGDTLWGIASMFLTEPWLWPEIWYVNSDIENPHLIYPGDQIILQYVGANPRLTVRRAATERRFKLTPEHRIQNSDNYEKLEPRIRVKPLSAPIPAIPLDAIASLMSKGRIVEEDTLSLAPRILSGKSGRLIFGSGDQVYARGNWPELTSVYGIFRPGNVYIDPVSEEILGFEAIEVGSAKIQDRAEDLITFTIISAREDVRIGYRMMLTEQQPVKSIFYPSSPDIQINGVILNVLGGVTQVGRYDVVVINRGSRSGLDVGNVLSIAKKGAPVKDRFDRGVLDLPASRAGILMLFRVFEKMAYGLVLQASEPLRVGDVVQTP